MQGKAIPLSVVGYASYGVANEVLGIPCEDTITLAVEWENTLSKNKGHAIYTSSWIEGKSDVHTQQRF